MDLGSFLGIGLSFGLILLGNKLEGGHVSSLIQATAMLIVAGGTVGACVLQFPPSRVIAAMMATITIFFRKKAQPGLAIAQIVDFARRARREGILALEKEIPNIKDPFFAKALRMAVDGFEPKTLVETMETEMGTLETDEDFKMKVWEAAGGYAPTVGILGAVLGLIHVMSNLENPAALGGGIATAFVATIYGVGMSNLICLPFANKLKFNSMQDSTVREIELKGILLIQEGINHTVIEEQLKSYLDAKMKKKYEAANGKDKRK